MVTRHFHFNGFLPNMLYFFSFISIFLRRLYLVTPTFIIEPKKQAKPRFTFVSLGFLYNENHAIVAWFKKG